MAKRRSGSYTKALLKKHQEELASHTNKHVILHHDHGVLMSEGSFHDLYRKMELLRRSTRRNSVYMFIGEGVVTGEWARDGSPSLLIEELESDQRTPRHEPFPNDPHDNEELLAAKEPAEDGGRWPGGW